MLSMAVQHALALKAKSVGRGFAAAYFHQASEKRSLSLFPATRSDAAQFFGVT